jgi:hypothetical protein
MHRITRVLSLGVPFIFGVGVGWIVQGRHWDVFLTSYVPALATLVAAYYGAKYAFQFQKDKEVEDNKKRNIINGNSTIFNMMRMTSDLTNFQKQIIDPVRGRQTCFLEMRPTPHFDKEMIKLNIETLYFLLDTDDRNLLGELVTEEERYQSALVAINERSDFHRQEVQPVLDRLGVVQGGYYTVAQIEKMLGDRLYTTLCHATDQAIDHVDSTIVSLKEVADKLNASLKKQFPNETIIGFGIVK